MKLLITGGAGFIGSNFIRYIFKKYPDYKIINLDKLTYAGNLDNLIDVEHLSNYKFVKSDICNQNIVSELAKESDVIVNFAAETHVDRSIFSPGSFIQTDIFGTYTLLEAVKKYNKKYIHISTDEVYGSIEHGSFNEQSPCRPNSPYSASKASADLLIRSYIVTYGVSAIIIRPSNNFGPYQYPEKMIPLFITNVIDNIKLPVYGDGLYIRDWLYVIDNCRAIDIILHKGIWGEIYNVSAGNEITNIELTKKILELLNTPETFIEYVKDRPGHDRRYSIDSTKLKTELGWQPQYKFDDALRETVEWYKKNRTWWSKIKHISKEYKEFYKKQYNK